VSDTGSWWQKGKLEADRNLPAAPGLAERTDRLERVFGSELTSSMSLNLRGTALAAASSIGVLMLAQFSAIWLDDNRWRIPDLWDYVLLVTLTVTVVAFGLAALIAGVAVWPKRRWAGEQQARLAKLASGDEAGEAALLLEMVERQRRVNERRGRLLRIAAIAFAIALLGTVIQAMVFALMAEPADPVRTDRPSQAGGDESGLPSPDDQLRLAQRYAPRVWLHPAEQFGPLDPAVFVGASLLGWRLRRSVARVESRGRVSSSRLGARCKDAAGGCYEHEGYFSNELTRPFAVKRARPANLNLRRGFFLDVADPERRGQARRNPNVPVFFELRRTPDELLVTYWFFYGYSRPHVVPGLRGGDVLRDRLSHEGDWENVDVALAPDASRPVAVYLYGHGTPARVRWAQVQPGPSGHPLVYSARDSHASYAKEGPVEVCNPLGCALDVSAQGFRWDTWTALRPVRSEPWYGFGGAWGVAGSIGDRTGPLGPSRWKLPADPDPGDLAPVSH
jgi:hypothetical protein